MQQRRGLGQLDRGAATVARPPQRPVVIAEDYYVYQIQFEDVTSGATQTGFIQIEADSDFLIQKFGYLSNVAGDSVEFNTLDVPLVTVLIIDTGSGRQLMNSAVPLGAFWGDGRLPYILPTPKLFVKNTRINVTIFNFSDATDYADIWLAFQGKKIFTSG